MLHGRTGGRLQFRFTVQPSCPSVRAAIQLQLQMKQSNVCVEGNVGSGKSTLVNQVKNELEKLTKGIIRTVQEPVEKWQETKHNGKNILELSYTKPEKYSMSFQTQALSDMMEGYFKTEEPYDICIFERNPSTTINVFATNLNNKGYLNELEMKVLKNVEKTFVMTGNITEIDLTIYLETKPQIAHYRVK